MTKEQKMEAMQKIVMDCAAKENASQADLDELMSKKPATSPTAKCHRACLHETFGTVSSIDYSSIISRKKHSAEIILIFTEFR